MCYKNIIMGRSASIELIDKLINEKYNNYHSHDNIFSLFKPFDDIIIIPLIKLCRPFVKFFGYKSSITGFVSIVLYLSAIYFSYKGRHNLVWIFMFLGSFVRYLDNMFYKKYHNIEISTDDTMEFMVNLIIHIIIFMILENKHKSHEEYSNYLYFIIFMSIILLISEFNIKKIITNKLDSQVTKKFKIIQIFAFVVLFLCIYLLINHKDEGESNDDSILDIFIKK
jgi:hypothetical protein